MLSTVEELLKRHSRYAIPLQVYQKGVSQAFEGPPLARLIGGRF